TRPGPHRRSYSIRRALGYHRRMCARVLTLWSTCLLATSCADQQSPTWAELDRPERLAFMTDEVEPMMRAIFQERDPQRFAAFGCPSCHGPDPEGSDYAMPAFLGALPLEGTIEAAEQRNPE